MITSIEYRNGKIKILDQTQLPEREVFVEIRRYEEMIDAIKKLKVRGAPLIGVSAAYGIFLGCQALSENKNLTKEKAIAIIEQFRQSRPTAVNLMWACDKMLEVVHQAENISELLDKLFECAVFIHQEDVVRCENIGKNGSSLFDRPINILTHCNTGFLATAGQGTALSVICELHKKSQIKNVWVDETRPLFQGGRLTAWECQKLGIPFTGISDNMAAYVMSQGKVDAVITGADRIASNGDSANKIGTLNLAVLANHYKIPFYIAAPENTIDRILSSGSEIVIEERAGSEVLGYKDKMIFPTGSLVYNPAFDVTPNHLISGIITDVRVYQFPYRF